MQAKVTPEPRSPSEAANLLKLIRAELLRPVNPNVAPILLAVYASDALIYRGLAARAPNPAGLVVSRDLMFAIGLIAHPEDPHGRR